MKKQIPCGTSRLLLIALYLLLAEGCVTDKECVTSDASTIDPKSLDKVHKSLVLHDFDQAKSTNNLGGVSSTWTSSLDASSESEFALVSTERRGCHSNALHISYKFYPDHSLRSRTGFRTELNNLDASDYDHVEFLIKGDKDHGYSPKLRIAFLRPEDESPKYTESGSYIVTGINDDWERIRVPLNMMNGIKDWTNLKALIISFHSRRSITKQGAYYIDDIALIKTGDPGPSVLDAVTPMNKKEREQSDGGQAAARKEIPPWKRLVGWPSTLLVDKNKNPLPKDDKQFLRRLAKDTWNGLNALTDRVHGLPLDTVRFGKNSISPERSRIGDYTNITNIGLYMLSIVAATDFEFITRKEALEKLNKTLTTLGELEKFEGFYFNYYDTTTLKRTSNFISFVDSSWLTAGLMVVRMAFPELYERSTKLIEMGNYDLFYDKVEQLMRHGYWTNLKYHSEYHYGLLYTESRVGSLIAIGKGDVRKEHWFKMLRTFPPITSGKLSLHMLEKESH